MFSARQRGLILATVCFGMFMSMLDNTVVGTALPRISAELGVGMTGLQWVMEGYSLVYAALLLAGGTLGDRFGRRGFFLTGLAVFTACSAVCASASSLAVLVSGRVVQGLGAAALTPQSLAILRTPYPDDASGARAIGVWSGVSALGLALGPAIGGPLVSHFGWQSAFWINVPVGLVGLVLGLCVLPRIPGRPRGFDTAGQVCAALGLTTAVYALIEGPAQGWTSTRVLAAFAVAAACLAAYVPIERAARSPMIDLDLFRDPAYTAAALSGFSVSFGMFGILTYLGLYMQDVLGFSPAQAGYASLPANMMIVIVGPLASRMALRYGPRLPLVTGLLCCAAGIGGTCFYGLGARYAHFWWLLPLIGGGMGLSFTPISITMLGRVPTHRAGMSSGIMNASREAGGVAGIAVMGAILTARLGHVLSPRLSATHLPAVVAHQIIHTATSGGAQGLSATARMPGTIRTAVLLSFTDGLHLAVLCASALLVVGAACVATLMPRGRTALATPAAGTSALGGRPRGEAGMGLPSTSTLAGGSRDGSAAELAQRGPDGIHRHTTG